MNLKNLVMCAALGATLVGSAFAADQKTLRMATESTYPPFEFFDSKTGETVGFDIELMQAVAKLTGYKLEVVSMGFDAIIPSLLTGSADAGVSAITITKERAKRLLFSQPYYESGLSILIRASDKDKITKVEHLNNRTLCVQIGTSGAMRAQEVPGAKVKNFNTVAETFLELNNKGCDAVIGDRPVNGYFMATRANAEADFYHLPVTLNTENFGIAVSKKNKKLHKEIDDAVSTLKANGEYARIYRKWFGEEPPAAK